MKEREKEERGKIKNVKGKEKNKEHEKRTGRNIKKIKYVKMKDKGKFKSQ